MSMSLIETKTLATATASIEFTAIPQTFTDLVFLVSARNSTTTTSLNFSFNGATLNRTQRRLTGTGSGTPSTNSETTFLLPIPGSSQGANIFGNARVYIPNYSLAAQKNAIGDAIQENNTASGSLMLSVFNWADTAAITSCTFTAAGTSANLIAGSTISLYGITRGSDGIVTVS